jgi:hypothetical protein
MKTRVSKAYRGKQHVGWKKTVAGREWFLGYGTSPGDEAKAIALAEVLEAKWRLLKAAGVTEITQTDFEEAKELLAGRPRWSSARRSHDPLVEYREASSSGAATAPSDVSPAPVAELAAAVSAPTPAAPEHARRWLHASIDEFVATTRKKLKPDGSNGDYVFNLIDNICRAREAIEDKPLDLLRRKELDDWLLSIRALRSKHTGKPLSAVTIRNIVAAVRAAMTEFAQWEWWVPPVLWERAFKGYSIKKLQTPAERKRRRKKPPAFTVDEKRVLWRMSLPLTRAMMALADWAGHTQTEIATLTFDEVREENSEMYIDRDRHKTGVHGRWWIPPEAAAEIRKVMARTPRDPAVNPAQLAFLTCRNMPLVHRATHGKRARSDYIGGNLWGSLLRAARHVGVKHISFKGMRKATAQLIRDEWGKEVSRTFLAHADEDIQDENYTRACTDKVEKAMRALYPRMKVMFTKIGPAEWPALRQRIREANGLPPEDEWDTAA